MTPHKKPTALILTVTVTVGCFLGVAWLARRFWPFPGLHPGYSGQITVLADTFSGYSTLRTVELQNDLKEEGISLHYEDEFDQAKRAEQLLAPTWSTAW